MGAGGVEFGATFGGGEVEGDDLVADEVVAWGEGGREV